MSNKIIYWTIGLIVLLGIILYLINSSRLPQHNVSTTRTPTLEATSTPVPTPEPIVMPTSTPQTTYPSKVFTCIDPTIGEPAPCVQDDAITCVDVSNGHAFRCQDAPRISS